MDRQPDRERRPAAGGAGDGEIILVRTLTGGDADAMLYRGGTRMKPEPVVEQLERLEDQLQAIKWAIRWPRPPHGRAPHLTTESIVARTAGLLQGRLPDGRTYQRRLRREWGARLAHEIP